MVSLHLRQSRAARHARAGRESQSVELIHDSAKGIRVVTNVLAMGTWGVVLWTVANLGAQVRRV
jgi:hypothetical protein